MKKKYYLLTIMVVLLGVLTGCGSTKEDTSFEDIKEKGTLVLGTSADYPPYEWHIIDGKNDEIVGVDIEIAKKLADDLGVKLEVKDMQFNGLIPALDAGDIDMIIAGMVVDEQRLKAADFTDPYFEQGQNVLVRKDDLNKFKSVNDLKNKKIGSQLGSQQQTYAEENFEAEIVAIPNNNDLILELKNGTLDAIFMSELTAKQFASIHDDLVIADISDIPSEGGSCVAVRKGATSLKDALNESVSNLNKTDQVDQWFIEYSKLAEEQAN